MSPIERGITAVADLAAENAALRARVAELEHKQEKWHEVIDANERALTSLTAQLRQVKADAERWRWIRTVLTLITDEDGSPDTEETGLLGPRWAMLHFKHEYTGVLDEKLPASVDEHADAARRNDGTA